MPGPEPSVASEPRRSDELEHGGIIDQSVVQSRAADDVESITPWLSQSQSRPGSPAVDGASQSSTSGARRAFRLLRTGSTRSQEERENERPSPRRRFFGRRRQPGTESPQPRSSRYRWFSPHPWRSSADASAALALDPTPSSDAAPTPEAAQQGISLDTNLEHIDDIVAPDVAANLRIRSASPTTSRRRPSSDSAAGDRSDGPSRPPSATAPAPPVFISGAAEAPGTGESTPPSPMTRAAPRQGSISPSVSTHSQQGVPGMQEAGSSWMAPDSWAVLPTNGTRDSSDMDAEAHLEEIERSQSTTPTPAVPVAVEARSRNPSISSLSNVQVLDEANVPSKHASTENLPADSGRWGKGLFGPWHKGFVRDTLLAPELSTSSQRPGWRRSAQDGASTGPSTSSEALPLEKADAAATAAPAPAPAPAGALSSSTRTALFAVGSAAANAATGRLGFHRNRASRQPVPARTPDMDMYSVLPGPDGVADGEQRPTHMMRVYRPDGGFFTVACSLDATSAELLQALSRHETGADTQAYRLFVCEKGSERPLLPTECPTRIQTRRLLQAGYTERDNLDELGRQDLSFVLRFVWRPDGVPALTSAMLGEQQQTYQHLNLQGMRLEMVPVFVYKHADWIVSLDLSMNPMSDLPLDLVQRCVNLRMLRLSSLALKRVPQSVREIKSLTHLDVSSNRIWELDHIALDALPQLKSLKLVNNRIFALPAYTPSLQSLQFINLSNNRLEAFPEALCEVPTLVDVDLSFNAIDGLPASIRRLERLERLILRGNALGALPAELATLPALHTLDVRNNMLHSLESLPSMAKLECLLASDNGLTTVDASLGAHLSVLDLRRNPLSRAQLDTPAACRLTMLDLSQANLATLSESLFPALTSLTRLVLDGNQFVALPENIDVLMQLEHLSVAGNMLHRLPDSLGALRHLRRLDAQNNNLRTLPLSLWHCAELYSINVSSNVLDSFPVPPGAADSRRESTVGSGSRVGRPDSADDSEVNGAASRAGTTSATWPLCSCLMSLRMADNRLTDEIFSILTLFKELEVLNLSMNNIYEVPDGALAPLGELRELYLSGNKLGTVPSDDLEHLVELRVLYLNGNRLQSLPAELGLLKRLESIDVGNNMLKYNIANWHYDWNWNSNPELRFLNLSGNQRFEIKPKITEMHGRGRNASDFNRLRHLQLLGLMEVTMTHQPLPDESEFRRVRTTLAHINAMPYGIADTLGRRRRLQLFDLVVPKYRKREQEALFGLFEAHGAEVEAGVRTARFLVDNCADFLQAELDRTDSEPDAVPTALRRAFLNLDRTYAERLMSVSGKAPPKGGAAAGSPRAADMPVEQLLRGSAEALVAFLQDRTLHIANVGDALAVISRTDGAARVLGVRHDPLRPEEFHRVRAAEGWVSLRGMLNDVLETARVFGRFDHSPVANSCPTVASVPLTDADEFVILASPSLWRHVSPQMAVDVARMDRKNPKLAAQKLRDIALGFGAEAPTAVMVVAVSALFHEGPDPRLSDTQALQRGFETTTRAPVRRGGRSDNDSTLARLDREVLPPIGQVALVFTDIKHSTLLWESNPGMQSAMRLHNHLLRRQLRAIGGYEVKTEGDAFMVTFQSLAAALLWCFTVQLRLLSIDWPQEILDSPDGHTVYDEDGTLLYRGLAVRMGVHYGWPVCEVDPVNARMDYFGPMVNRAARISAAADGGQIMVSYDAVQELSRLLATYDDGEDSGSGGGDASTPLHASAPRDLVLLRRLGLGIISVGERRLKGIEIPENLSLVFPKQLSGRYQQARGIPREPGALQVYEPTRQLVEVDQIRQLGLLCLRLEALSNGRCFPGISRPANRQSTADASTGAGAPGRVLLPREERNRVVEQALARNPELLLVLSGRDEATDSELVLRIAQLVTRVQNSASSIALRHLLTHDDMAYASRLLSTFHSLVEKDGISTLPIRMPDE